MLGNDINKKAELIADTLTGYGAGDAVVACQSCHHQHYICFLPGDAGQSCDSVPLEKIAPGGDLFARYQGSRQASEMHDLELCEQICRATNECHFYHYSAGGCEIFDTCGGRKDISGYLAEKAPCGGYGLVAAT